MVDRVLFLTLKLAWLLFDLSPQGLQEVDQKQATLEQATKERFDALEVRTYEMAYYNAYVLTHRLGRWCRHASVDEQFIVLGARAHTHTHTHTHIHTHTHTLTHTHHQ